MKTHTKVIGLIGICLLAPGLATAAEDNVAAVAKASAVMAKCTRIAQDIAGVRVPPDLAQAKLFAATNEKVTDPKDKKSIDPVSEQYMRGMERDNGRLADCGKEYQATVKDAEAAAQEAGKRHQNDKQAAKSAADFASYQKSKEDLATAIAALSKDPQVEAYVAETLRTYFLK
jgi:hypothetical protein